MRSIASIAFESLDFKKALAEFHETVCGKPYLQERRFVGCVERSGLLRRTCRESKVLPTLMIPSRGAPYNEKADKRSWQAMKSFFAEIF